jgi:hypothetical protein
MINLEAEQMRLEQKLQGMMLAKGDDFTVYAARFNEILVAPLQTADRW